MKVLWFDVETTGLDAQFHDIHQLAGVLEVNGKVVEEFEYHIRPINWRSVQPKALEVSGVTMDDLKGPKYKDPAAVHRALTVLMGRHINKYDKTDKAYPGAYNGTFDTDFLASFFRKVGDKYYGSWINHRLLDPLSLVRALDYRGLVHLQDHKLATVCEAFDIEHAQAHDALADIRATRALWLVLSKWVMPPKQTTHQQEPDLDAA